MVGRPSWAPEGTSVDWRQCRLGSPALLSADPETTGVVRCARHAATAVFVVASGAAWPQTNGTFPSGMAFNLKKVLKALLFSSSQPLSIGEIQETFTRFHEKDPLLGGLPAGDSSQGEGTRPSAAPAVVAPGEPPAELPLEAPVDEELYRDVPTLVTAAQIREAMEEIALGFRAADDVFFLTETAQGYRLVTQPRFARWVRTLRNEPPPVKLSQSALETLAVIAYRQPVTRAEI